MIWAPIAAFGLVAWLSAAVFIIGLCRAAGRADELASVCRASDQRSVFVTSESNVVDLSAFRAARTASVVCAVVADEGALIPAPTSAAAIDAGP